MITRSGPHLTVTKNLTFLDSALYFHPNSNHSATHNVEEIDGKPNVPNANMRAFYSPLGRGLDIMDGVADPQQKTIQAESKVDSLYALLQSIAKE